MDDYDPYGRLDPVARFDLTSDTIAHGQPLPRAQFSAEVGGSDRSPELSWSGFPDGTKSFAVTMFDPDAPTGSGFWHWAVFDIPAGVTSLAAGAGDEGGRLLPDDAVTLPNEYRRRRYEGANPPEGTGAHRYFTVVHAVDVDHLGLDPDATPAVLGFNLHYHTLGRAILVPTGQYGDS